VPILKDAENPHILSLSPPLNITPRWLGAHTGYTLAKYGMTMATLGLAAEFAKDGIAANTLWPETTIATAAVQFALGGDRMMKVSRTPRSTPTPRTRCSAARARVHRSDAHRRAGAADAGVTDFSGYAATPGTPDSELFPDIFL
jgi:citronellol/citronellal dehydrogenase